MNVVEIEKAVSQLASKAFDPATFFLVCVGARAGCGITILDQAFGAPISTMTPCQSKAF
ncbi:hypothetical protein [Rhodovibrio sodomensis]|uniref:hypothetical protein n=1 Tax=Rhodovibrio sodomensis TaxID=1088 RepID=UPI001A928AE1|nr:hypothetical protein [Rhodovibrio sodomensis]